VDGGVFYAVDGAEFAAFANKKGIKAKAPMSKSQSDAALKARAQAAPPRPPEDRMTDKMSSKSPYAGRWDPRRGKHEESVEVSEKKKISEEQINEKSVSQAQQKFMGMVYAAKKGMKPASPEVAKAAKSMTTKAARDFAKTKHSGLPKHVEEAAKPKMTALEKFKASLKKSGYDPEERAKKMNALIDKHKKEREEMEKKYPNVYGEK